MGKVGQALRKCVDPAGYDGLACDRRLPLPPPPPRNPDMMLQQFLADQSVAFETVVHPPAFTAQKRAKFLHISGHQVVKAVLLRGPAGFVLAVLPAPQHIDLALLARYLEGPVRLATDAEIEHVFLDCELGSLTPFGSIYGVPTILEASLASDIWITCEAQRHAVAVKMLCRDFERIEKPRRLRFGR